MTIKTMGTLLAEGTRTLQEAGIEEASLDAWLLLEFVTGISRAHYFAWPEESVEEDKALRYQELLRQRAERVPLQHLTHQAFFMGYEFYVDGRVLIPRQDTETLAEEALTLLKSRREARILDMCTGSGCILLSILLEKPDSTGLGVDASSDALAVAGENARRLQVTDRAKFVHSDLFEKVNFEENSSAQAPPYDILISNPPYIRSAEIDSLMEEVRLHDPRMALDGREDGLWFYREITRQAAGYLREDGWLLYEIGYDQGEDVAGIMRDCGYREVSVIRDLAGQPRVVKGLRPIQEEKNV